ncbi:MAG: hypothetical protein AAFY38_06775 [Pseudomonadota bacterium]
MSALRVIHAGFHKTGTSTIEHMLLRNAAQLKPHVAVIAGPQLTEAVRLAKRYSAQPSGGTLEAFADTFAAAMPAPDVPTLVSCVDLCGFMPGHPSTHGHDAFPALVRAMRAAGPARFAFGTRPAADWLRSLWLQNLKVQRLTDDFATFAARFAPISDLNAEAAKLEAAAGGAVLRLPLEAGSAHPLGPAGPLLDLFEVPHEGLELQPALKVGLGDEAAALLLEMNRSGLPDDALRATKSDALALLKAQP